MGGLGQVSHFRVCHPLGKVVANRTVDYEEVQWLNFTVRASDNGSPRRSAEIPVYLQIVDINDNNPLFTQPSYQVSWAASYTLCVRLGERRLGAGDSPGTPSLPPA